MSIMIKGMEKPKSCLACDFCNPFTEKPYCRRLMKVTPKTATLPDCQIIRLTKRIVYRGDVYNAIEAERIKALDGVLIDRYKDGFHDGLKRALQILENDINDIDDAPTVIPADKDGET